MSTLEEVLATGEGLERPFRCHEHDDHDASASVNMLKGVWYCFACGARGKVDGKAKAPSLAELEYMLQPEAHPRHYPESYLEMFSRLEGHWGERFPAWLRWALRMGTDPLTGDATFPVRTPRGLLAGVGRRLAVPHPDRPKARYEYPPRWSATGSFFLAGYPHEVVVLVEGAADGAAVCEVGVCGRSCYGSGIHAPQLELLRRLAPKLVLVGFDADIAGDKGADQAFRALENEFECARVDWSDPDSHKKDPAELSPETRLEVLLETVAGTQYGARHEMDEIWWQAVRKMRAGYEQAMEDE